MGNQVSNWLYSKKDYAIKALTQWVGTVYTGSTTDEVISKLSTEKSVRVYGSNLFTDDGEFELIVRPFSRSIGSDLGSKTGCMTFNVSVDHQASINGLYGAIDLDNVIYQVFKACGVVIEDVKLKHYNLAVRDRMGIGALNYYTGVVIKLESGLLIGYVGKKIVQDIIDGMAAEGMFNITHTPVVNIDSITQTGWYTLTETPVLDRDNLFYLASEVIRRAGEFYQINHPAKFYRLPGPSLIRSAINNIFSHEWFNNKTINVDYNTITVQAVSSQYASNGVYIVQLIFSVDLLVDAMNVTYISDMTQVGSYIQKYILFSQTLNTYIGCTIATYSDMTQDSVSQASYSNNYRTNMAGWSYNVLGSAVSSTFNTTMQEEGPEGITYEAGATIPTEESHLISTVYPSWKTSSNQTISPAKNFSSRALIALSFTGDTQYNTQEGVITTNEMLQRLGVNVESTEEYVPIGGEEGEDEPVIRPDPSPTPNDSPTDEYPDSNTPASKYMVSVWNMTDAMVQSFAGALWSNTVWNAIKDFFTKPTDAVIAMFTLYGVDVGDGTPSQEIKLGGHGTGVNAIPVTTRFKTVDLGNAVVPEFYANVEDYAPYSSAEIFLPFIGYAKIDVNEIMNSTVNIKYVFDMWTGSLVARIFVTRDGVKQELYNFNGSSAVQIPLTDRDYTNALSSLLSGALETARNVAVAAGITAATGGSALVPALTGLASGLSAIGNHAQGIKNRVVRSGSLGSIYGAMANKKACIYIKRPVAYNANNYQHYYGFPANWTCTLRECSGFTRVKDIHLDTVTCTDEERIEIETLLKQGVML